VTRQAHRRRFSVPQWLAALSLLIVMMSPSAVRAHASLLATEPANDALLAAGPAMLTLTFDEAVEPLVIKLIDEHGAASAVSRIERRGASLVLTAPPDLGPGAHVVSWRVISADGHPVGGSFAFWIGHRGTVLPEVVSSDNPSVRIAIWATRLVIYFGLFVGAGGAFFMAWISPRAVERGPKMASVATSVAALIALVLSLGWQGIDALGASPSAWLLPAVWRTGAHGSFGWSAAIAALALILALLSLRHGARSAKALSLCGLIGVGLALAVSGHAALAAPRYLTAPAVFLHGVSLAFWIGALLPLAYAVGPRGPQATDTLTRFSRWIPFAVIALLASGILIAAIQLTRVDALWSTDYGRVLCVKIALVLVLLAIALWNRIVLTPQIVNGAELPRRRMQRAIAAELVLVALILGVVGVWRFTPPPRALFAAGESFFTHLHTQKLMANVTISPGRAGPIEITVQLETADETPMDAMAVTVTLSNPDVGIEPITAQAQRLTDGQWQVHMAAPVPGRWSLGLGVLISDFDKVNVEAPILIR
jgi:copper transport protein